MYRPEGGPVPDDSVPRLFGGFRLTADVDVPDAARWPASSRAMGDWTGGFAFFVRDGRLVFVLNRAGDEGRVESDVPVPTGRHELSCVYTPGLAGPGVGLFHDDELVAHAVLPVTAPLVFQHGGTMFMLGYDRGLPVARRLRAPLPVDRRAPPGRDRDRRRDPAVDRRSRPRLLHHEYALEVARRLRGSHTSMKVVDRAVERADEWQHVTVRRRSSSPWSRRRRRPRRHLPR